MTRILTYDDFVLTAPGPELVLTPNSPSLSDIVLRTTIDIDANFNGGSGSAVSLGNGLILSATHLFSTIPPGADLPDL